MKAFTRPTWQPTRHALDVTLADAHAGTCRSISLQQRNSDAMRSIQADFRDQTYRAATAVSSA